MENYSPGSIADVFHCILPSSDVVRIGYPLALLCAIEYTSSNDPFYTHASCQFVCERIFKIDAGIKKECEINMHDTNKNLH